MEVTLEPLSEDESKQQTKEPTPPPPPTSPEPKPSELSSVDTKRQNKTYTCSNCGKSMNKKTLLYSHKCKIPKRPEPIPTPPNTQPQTVKPKQEPAPRIIQTVKEVYVPQEITDEHVEKYLNKKQEESKARAIKERSERFSRLMMNAF